MNKYYVYFHKDDLGNIRYIGHGTGNRAYSKTSRNKEHLNIIDDLEVVIHKNLLSKEEAENLEQELITEHFPNGLLLNKIKNISYSKELDYRLFENDLYLSKDSKTGLKWKIEKRNVGMVLKEKDSDAGCFSETTGYYYVRVNNILYACHRVVYVLANRGIIPRGMVVDHIDRNKLNNNPSNLRLTTHYHNRRNVSVRKDSTTGINGVQWDTAQNRYIVDYRLHDGTHKRKIFNPRTLYPSIIPEEAKQKAFKDAVAFRKQMEELYYK